MSLPAVDHYKTLGLVYPSSEAEVKLAFRRLAMVWHPDRNQGAKKTEAESVFKEVKAAYEVLGDPRLKIDYDKKYRRKEPLEHFASQSSQTRTNSGNGKESDSTSEFIAEFYTSRFAIRDVNDVVIPVGVSVSQAMSGCVYVIDGSIKKTCEHCHGCGGNRMRCVNCHGSGRIGGKKCESCDGLGFRMIHCDVCGGSGKIEVKNAKKIRIPAGVVNGTKVRVAGKRGDKSSPGLILDISINTSDEWRCVGEDFFGGINIGFSQALFGGVVEINSPTGSTLEIKIPAMTDSSKTIRLGRMGLFNAETKRMGDIKLTTRIVLPQVNGKIPENIEAAIRLLDGGCM